MKTKKYIFHSDPSHGWLAVKRKELEALNLLDQVTNYSYQRGGTVYLEEDQDASLFIKTYREKYKCDPEIKSSYQDNSPVRSYESFKKDGSK